MHLNQRRQSGKTAAKKAVAKEPAIAQKCAAEVSSKQVGEGTSVLILYCSLAVAAFVMLREEMSNGSPKKAVEIQGIAIAGRIAADAMTSMEEPLLRLSLSSNISSAEGEENLTTQALDLAVHQFLAARGATAEPLLYGGFTGSLLRPTEWPTGRHICKAADAAVSSIRRTVFPGLPPLPFCGFPAYSCISVNSEVCHGVPSGQVIRSGDLVKIDIAARKDGFIGDTCATFIAGGDQAAEPRALHFSEVAREALFLGILAAGAVNRTFGDIGHAVQKHVQAEGFTIVTMFSGHGVGRSFHEPPRIHHTGSPGRGGSIQENQTFTIEPILAEGPGLITVADDGWTVLTRDGSLAAQWEHTVTTTRDSVQILTFRRGESWPSRLSSKEERAQLFLRAGYNAAFSSRLEAAAELLLL